MSEKIALSNEKKKSTMSENSATQTKRSDPFQFKASPVERILLLQRTIGNHAVERLARSGSLMAKLRIGQPGDEYEQEADRVADQVMRMTDIQVGKANDASYIRRGCHKCREDELKRQPIKEEEDEEKIQRQPKKDEEDEEKLRRQPAEEEDEEKLQAKGSDIACPESIENRISSLKGGGNPLSEGERAFFEPRFGADFSQVRLHTDTNAAQIARSLNARAFASGNNVVFGEGEYAPGAGEGRRILGHELTHVIQQIGNDLMQVRRQTPGHAANPAPRSRNDMINQARLGAWLRCHRAYERLAGIGPPPPPGRPDPAQEWRRRARSLARTIFREDLNMDQVTDIVESMRNRLSPGLTSVRAPPNDPECGGLRDAYVVGNRPPVHLCPRFFMSSKTDDDRITTMIHESAHMAGIGEGSGNEYCFYVDCDTDPGCGGFNFADSWTQFVLCLSR